MPSQCTFSWSSVRRPPDFLVSAGNGRYRLSFKVSGFFPSISRRSGHLYSSEGDRRSQSPWITRTQTVEWTRYYHRQGLAGIAHSSDEIRPP
jgi:hypothetical protein